MIELDLIITCTHCKVKDLYSFKKGTEWYEESDEPSVQKSINADDKFEFKQTNPDTFLIECSNCGEEQEFML